MLKSRRKSSAVDSVGASGPSALPEAAAAPDLARLRRKSELPQAETEPYLGYYLVSQGWAMTAPAMAVGFLLLALMHAALPPVSVMACVGVAVAVASQAQRFVGFERGVGRTMLQRVGALLAGVVAPMALFGQAMALWGKAQPAPPSVASLGVMLVVTLVVAIVLSGRLFSMVGALAALWAPLALESAAPVEMAAFLIGTGIGLVAALR